MVECLICVVSHIVIGKGDPNGSPFFYATDDAYGPGGKYGIMSLDNIPILVSSRIRGIFDLVRRYAPLGSVKRLKRSSLDILDNSFSCGGKLAWGPEALRTMRLCILNKFLISTGFTPSLRIF